MNHTHGNWPTGICNQYEAEGQPCSGWRLLEAEVERQARHIEELQQKIVAEKSCCCSYDAQGDVCVAHSPALAEARAEVERLRAAATSAGAALAAAIELLERGRRAAPSKRMFGQMLSDYRATVARTRKALEDGR